MEQSLFERLPLSDTLCSDGYILLTVILWIAIDERSLLDNFTTLLEIILLVLLWVDRKLGK